MILDDTSIWIDHLHKGSAELVHLLEAGEVYCHPFIVGELACGSLKNRMEILTLMSALPGARVAEHEEALSLLNNRKLHSKELGWIDVHLLASALLTGCGLWTRDKALRTIAEKLKLHPR